MNLKEYKVQTALGLISYGDKYIIILNSEDTELLEYFSKDKDYYIRSYVAENKNTPVKMLELLSRDENYYVRSYVAKNKNTPVKILRLLAEDEDSMVRHEAEKRLRSYSVNTWE